MYDAGYYHELYEQGDFFEDDDDVFMLLNTYLNDPDYRNEEHLKLDWVGTRLVYKDEVVNMNQYMDDLLADQKVMGDSDKFNEIVHYIRKRGSVTKVELMEWLNWGRGIKWSPYRRALMEHPNIYDVNDGEPKYCWKE